MKLTIALLATCMWAQQPDRQESVQSAREVRIFGIPVLKITNTRRGSASGDPKRGPKMIPVPRDPLAEQISAAKGKRK